MTPRLRARIAAVGLNVAVAAGAVQHLGAERHPVVPNGYLRFGYAF